MSKYSKRVKKLKRMQLILVAACVVAFLIWIVIFTRPEISEYDLRDECGPIGGTISHSIDDEDACINFCNANCQSLDKEYHSSQFSLRTLECNSCKCFCKE